MVEMSFSIQPCLEFQQTEGGGRTITVFWLLKLVFEHIVSRFFVQTFAL